jgi:hypothetical protein
VGATVQWNQGKFEEAFREYMQFTSRTLQVAINTKAYYIARRALWNTVKADQYKIISDLGGLGKVTVQNRKGKMVKRNMLFLKPAHYHDAPLAAIIVNARLGAAGRKGLYGKAMERAIRKLLAARKRSVAFIKSGWLPAIKMLGPLSDRRKQPPIDIAARQVGRAKGTAKPARSNTHPVAEIVNLASARRDEKGALIRYGSGALDQAFMEETASMWAYIEEKMRPGTAAFNAKQK